MSSKKIAAIVLVMGIGVLVSFFIINGSSPISSQNISASIAPSDKFSQISLPENPIKWVESLISGKNSQNGEGNLSESAGPQQNIQVGDINSGNLTNNLTSVMGQSMFSHMQSLDQSGQNPFQNFDTNNPDNQKLLQQAVDSVQNPTALFNFTVSDKDLKISDDNSNEAKEIYLEKIQAISKKYLSDPRYVRTMDKITSSISSDCLIYNENSVNLMLATAYKNTADEYLNTNVPFDWKDIHRRMISYFENFSLVWSAIGNCTKDPIKGYAGAQALPSLFDEWLNIHNLLNETAF